MIDIGDVIEIGGEEGTICFKTTYNETPYMCVAFEKPNLRYDFYKYLIEDGKLMVSLLKDEEEIATLTKIFTEESINEYGMPEEIEKIFDNENNVSGE